MRMECRAEKPMLRSRCAASPRMASATLGSYSLMCIPSPAKECLPEECGGVFAPGLAEHVEPHPRRGRDNHRSVAGAVVDAEPAEVADQHQVGPAVYGFGLQQFSCVMQVDVGVDADHHFRDGAHGGP